jgi:predicted nucleic acid-binding protein
MPVPKKWAISINIYKLLLNLRPPVFQQDTVLAEPSHIPQVELQDKDDLPILGAAIAAGAEVLVTGDKELLDLGPIENLEILSPRQFWEKLKAQQQRRAGRGKPRRSR